MDFFQIINIMDLQSDVEGLKNGLFFALGLLLHILREMWVQQVSLREYLENHASRTLLSAGSLVGSFYFLMTSYPEAPLMVYFLGGYCIDSIMNKAPLSIKKVKRENIV